MSALKKFATTVPTQTEQANSRQVKNNAGGFVYEVSDVARLERFLIIGTDKGTYYVTEKDITKQNVDFIRKMIQRDPGLVLSTAVKVSDEGRAYRNDAAIFVMAVLLTDAPGDFKSTVVDNIPKVIRIATHAYELAAFIEGLGGWGRAKRRAIAKWFEAKTPEQLAYQAVKYRQRDGWTLRDLMRLSHPTGVDQRVGNFILGKEYMPQEEVMRSDILSGFNAMQSAKTVNEVLSFLDFYPNLPWETIPTQFLKEPKVWVKLFTNNQLNGQALVRNITRLTKIGAFNDMIFTRQVAKKLVDSDMIAKTRLHPVQYLLALITHTEGQLQRNKSGYSYMFGSERKKDWSTVPVIVDALNEGFHKSFKSIAPADKRTLIGLDVSGSMGADALGIDLSAAQVSAAMAMVTARTEPWYQVMGFGTQFRDLNISPVDSLDTVNRKVRAMTMGGTDVAQPMVWALKNKIEVDTFIVYTDNESWAGAIQPDRALRDYRQKMGIDAKLVAVAASATKYTVGDPNDIGTFNVAGFDAQAPAVIADFSAGRL